MLVLDLLPLVRPVPDLFLSVPVLGDFLPVRMELPEFFLEAPATVNGVFRPVTFLSVFFPVFTPSPDIFFLTPEPDVFLSVIVLVLDVFVALPLLVPDVSLLVSGIRSVPVSEVMLVVPVADAFVAVLVRNTDVFRTTPVLVIGVCLPVPVVFLPSLVPGAPGVLLRGPVLDILLPLPVPGVCLSEFMFTSAVVLIASVPRSGVVGFALCPVVTFFRYQFRWNSPPVLGEECLDHSTFALPFLAKWAGIRSKNGGCSRFFCSGWKCPSHG